MARAEEQMRAKFGAAVDGIGVAKRRKPTRIENLTVTEISLVPTPANQHAKVVLFKSGDAPAQHLPAVPVQDTGRGLPPGWAATLAAIASPAFSRRKHAMAATAPSIIPEAQAGAPAGREDLLAKLRVLGRAAADAQGFTGQQLDVATLETLGLAAPGGAEILVALQATDG